MKELQLDLPAQMKDIVSKDIEKLNPVQLSAIEAGLLNLKDSFVISSPTASGKTLIAELLMVKAILESKEKSKDFSGHSGTSSAREKTKALYIVPLRALANEKHARFKEKYEGLGIKTAISTGDLDSNDMWLNNYDLIVLTSEKTDSLLRHNADFLRHVGVVVVDECHLITDTGRGPTLEVAITRLRKLNPSMIMLFLSATIENAKELASWINAKLVKSDFRPVKLYEGVYFGNKVWFEDRENFSLVTDEPPEIEIAAKTVQEGKQAIIFASSRRNAESIAEKCSALIRKKLSSEELQELDRLGKDAASSLESATPQCKRLASCIESGVAFHHAGLVGKQRSLVENAFRSKKIKIIAATPTLAAGVDLPAYRVLIRDARRYYPGAGFVFIPVLEYEQMRGRAGRPRYDKEGESILIAKSEQEARTLYNRFVLGEPELIVSKLAVEPVLRTHVLALISNSVAEDKKELLEFFAKTFWGHQYKNLSVIEEKLGKILKNLEKWNFIKNSADGFVPTKLGKRVAELYIDPLTAHSFLSAIEKYNANDFGLLQLTANTAELSPPLRVRKKDYDSIMNDLSVKEQKLMIEVPKEWDLEYEDFLDSIKTALAFEDWCLEYSEDMLFRKYSVAPGELHAKREIEDWLLYAIDELARIIGKDDAANAARRLRVRMKYGVKEELLQLIKLKSVGRVRARSLWNSGYKTLSDLRNAEIRELALVLSSTKVAESVKEQLGESGAALEA